MVDSVDRHRPVRAHTNFVLTSAARRFDHGAGSAEGDRRCPHQPDSARGQRVPGLVLRHRRNSRSRATTIRRAQTARRARRIRGTSCDITVGGGPDSPDKLWFYSSARCQATRTTSPMASTSTPASERVDHAGNDAAISITVEHHPADAQATPKNKFGLPFGTRARGIITPTLAPEAATATVSAGLADRAQPVGPADQSTAADARIRPG